MLWPLGRLDSGSHPSSNVPLSPPPSPSMATANQSTPRCSSREDWWDVSRRSRDVEHSSFFTTITVILCWLLGTSVRKTGRVLRTDMPRSQHRTGVSCFILSQQVLHLERQFSRRGKEEGANW